MNGAQPWPAPCSESTRSPRASLARRRPAGWDALGCLIGGFIMARRVQWYAAHGASTSTQQIVIKGVVLLAAVFDGTRRASA